MNLTGSTGWGNNKIEVLCGGVLQLTAVTAAEVSGYCGL